MTVITKKIALKCDTDGCDALAEKQIYLNGEYAQIRLCKKCAEKLYDALAAEFHSRKIGVKNEDKKQEKRRRIFL